MDEEIQGKSISSSSTSALLTYNCTPATSGTDDGQGSFGSPGFPSPNYGNQKRKR
jgi:hypothetical protein